MHLAGLYLQAGFFLMADIHTFRWGYCYQSRQAVRRKRFPRNVDEYGVRPGSALYPGLTASV